MGESAEFKVGDKVSWTHSWMWGSSVNFSAREGKVVNVQESHCIVRYKGKDHRVNNTDLRYVGSQNALTEALFGKAGG